jgi:SNF2 family DNA or RNA helicase
MRTGKTKIALDDYGRLELAGELQDLVVLAPGGVYKTWVKALQDHASTDLKSRMSVYVWESENTGLVKGRPRPGQRELENWLQHTGPRVLLVNIEAMSNVARARQLVQVVLQARKCMLAVDESTCIKNPKAKRAKFVCRTLGPHARARRILSGLPTPRSPLDIFMQFYFLDPRILGFPNYYTFRARYAVTAFEWYGGRRVEIVVGYKNQEELRQKIEPYSYRVEFRPQIPSTYTIEDVPLHPEQKRIYNDMLQFSVAQLSAESHVSATVVITQILRLHQILCGWTKDEHGVVHAIPEYRTGKLIDVLDRGGGKAVIWCSYDDSIRKVSDKLMEEYGRPSVARFWGGNTKQREDEERRFMNDPDCQFMVATPDAGGKGRTWDVADLVVYYSSTNDLEKRDQSEQRVQGVDKTRQVDYVDLITPNTIEIKILKALRGKINMAAAITGDGWREWLL